MKLKEIINVFDIYNIQLKVDNTTFSIYPSWTDKKDYEKYLEYDVTSIYLSCVELNIVICLKENNDSLKDKILNKIKKSFKNEDIDIYFHKDTLFIYYKGKYSGYSVNNYRELYKHIDNFIEALKKEINKNV